jgi:hypothetical protein
MNCTEAKGGWIHVFISGHDKHTKNPPCPLNLILIMTKTCVITYFRGYNCIPVAKVHTWTIDRNRTHTLSACKCSLWVVVGCFENYIFPWCDVVWFGVLWCFTYQEMAVTVHKEFRSRCVFVTRVRLASLLSLQSTLLQCLFLQA